MNVKLLRKVKKHILENPKRLFMGAWIRRKRYGDRLVDNDGYARDYADCGTAGCISGWAIILSKKRVQVGNHFDVGQHLLGLDVKQANKLFAPANWPKKFLRGADDDGTEKTAKITAARIEHFIKTKGAE